VPTQLSDAEREAIEQLAAATAGVSAAASSEAAS
jgi:hypothetical protein